MLRRSASLKWWPLGPTLERETNACVSQLCGTLRVMHTLHCTQHQTGSDARVDQDVDASQRLLQVLLGVHAQCRAVGHEVLGFG